MSLRNKNKGISIIGVLFLGLILLLVLGYYHVSVRSVVQNPTSQDNLNYVGGATTSFWNTYLAEPASYLWNDVWLAIFWRPFISNM